MLMELEALCDLAIKAAYLAGEVINQYRSSEFEVGHKQVGDSTASQIVTEVDRKAQQVIIETLAPSLEAHNLALLAEESTDDRQRFEKPAFWCIDPLDGTLAFVEKQPGFSVSIALVSQTGEPLIGVVYDPLQKDLYHAIKNRGVFINAKALTLPALDKNAPLLLTTDRSFNQHPWLSQTRQGLEQIAEKSGLPGAGIAFKVGAVMNACTILRQPNYCYFKYPRAGHSGGSVWDYAATACLFHEAGGIATDIYGKTLDLNRRESTFINHKGLLYTADKTLAEQLIILNHQLESSPA
ncbi:3'(2'),5'-bisphosphate nucleotidase CysQ family protein [Candidatus Venteria ishoeyi]|nr:inositol monophosphatase family protein [Candidatus Venteria ishoeyi]